MKQTETQNYFILSFGVPNCCACKIQEKTAKKACLGAALCRCCLHWACGSNLLCSTHSKGEYIKGKCIVQMLDSRGVMTFCSPHCHTAQGAKWGLHGRHLLLLAAWLLTTFWPTALRPHSTACCIHMAFMTDIHHNWTSRTEGVYPAFVRRPQAAWYVHFCLGLPVNAMAPCS